MSAYTLKDKQVAVVGLGLTGQSCVRFLLSQGARVSAFDNRADLPVALPETVSVTLGAFDASRLSAMDLILLSPGLSLSLPAVQQAQQAGVEVIGDIELFARFNTRPVVAISGSNGKSTVTSLVSEMLKSSGLKVAMGGNIGTPALDLLNDDYQVAVLELSSFQLETTHHLPLVAGSILNISEDHLDRYADLQGYRQAKLRIYQNAELCVVNREDPLTLPEEGGRQLSFGLSESKTGMGFDSKTGFITLDGLPLLDFKHCSLVGQHNLLNIQAAVALALAAGATMAGIKAACRDFKSLPHRCELVREVRGVRWIDDSKGTNIGATQAAIEGLRPTFAGRLFLIAGGDGKGADFSQLQSALNKVDRLICLGKDGPAIAKRKPGAVLVSTLEEAVNLAASEAGAGDMVLLSPACASLDMFQNYHHRGQVFARAVEALS
ncbi:UDP-N-acetylmuramoyl-L-alanine--D-glutamate ligase [Bowmanella dokdonensis]|uniref:UDP-N-acetylmuramoylalanine--D-glutamate ligase n=1 Tax=Bowmanella dokdonensis TaxID=751969 RepID=A0A939DLP9_9ALTE|nr:UDP-N-acetylmuramoyl-L-alanine--D-glutamate ligase [Bowmanella dokdonensis]MBN7824096.1 UDP-N-acetylmuramoyl-L-alanine--D-glutamate ligase [Bowmanella dokdonensis]